MRRGEIKSEMTPRRGSARRSLRGRRNSDNARGQERGGGQPRDTTRSHNNPFAKPGGKRDSPRPAAAYRPTPLTPDSPDRGKAAHLPRRTLWRHRPSETRRVSRRFDSVVNVIG